MKLKYLLPAALLAASLGASAVPAYPGLLERTLDDGSTVKVRLYGDEYFSYMTDEAGYLLTSAPGGMVSYKLADGVRVKATDAEVTRLRNLAETTEPVKAMRASQMQRLSKLNKEGRSSFCTVGDVHFLVLLVQYDDIKFNSPTIREDMDAMLNQEGYNKNGCKGSIRDYYIASSNGNFRPTFDVSKVITLSQASRYYTGGGKYDKIQDLVKEAVTLADPDVDFSKYCNVTPGVCDAVIIWYAGYSQADTSVSDYIWPHQGSALYSLLKPDNTTIDTYCCFNELNGGYHFHNKDGAMAGIGTPIHEFGHVMCMPDLYDPNYKVKSTPGDWSIFDSGPYLGDGYCPPTCSAYERWLFNWMEYEDVVDGTHYDLSNLNGGGKALRIPVLNKSGDPYKNEYFLLESRNRSGWDEYLPGDGMLIWHVDFDPTTWWNNQVNSIEKRKRCHIIAADGSANYSLGTTAKTSTNAAWPYKTNYLTPDSEITLNTNYVFAASKTGNSYISDIAHNAETGVTSFDYNVYKSSPEDVTVMATPTRGLDQHGEPTSDITFTWEPVEDATGYALTVYRINSSGTVLYEDDLDEKVVGNVNYYTLEGLSRTKLKLEYNAYVRVIKGLPSIEKSNIVTFIPNELNAAVGIDEITDEGNAVIRGLDGAIEAPAGAEIYNMQGMRCPATGLAPGIYVVRYGASAAKVIVR